MSKSGFNGFALPKRDSAGKGPSSIDIYSKTGAIYAEVVDFSFTQTYNVYAKPVTDGKYIYLIQISNATGSGSSYIYKYTLKGVYVSSCYLGGTFQTTTSQNPASLTMCGNYIFVTSGTGNYYIVDKDAMTATSPSISLTGSYIAGAPYYSMTYPWAYIFYINNILYIVGFSTSSTNIYIDRFSISSTGTLTSLGYLSVTLGTAYTYGYEVGVDYSSSLNSLCFFSMRETTKIYLLNLSSSATSTITINSGSMPAAYTSGYYVNFYCCTSGNFIVSYVDSSLYNRIYYVKGSDGSILCSDVSSSTITASNASYNKILVTKAGFYYSLYASPTKVGFVLNGDTTISTINTILNIQWVMTSYGGIWNYPPYVMSNNNIQCYRVNNYIMAHTDTILLT